MALPLLHWLACDGRNIALNELPIDEKWKHWFCSGRSERNPCYRDSTPLPQPPYTGSSIPQPSLHSPPMGLAAPLAFGPKWLTRWKLKWLAEKKIDCDGAIFAGVWRGIIMKSHSTLQEQNRQCFLLGQWPWMLFGADEFSIILVYDSAVLVGALSKWIGLSKSQLCVCLMFGMWRGLSR